MDQYNKEIDEMVDFGQEESKSKCLKISIIVGIIVLLLTVAAFLLVYFLL